MARPQEKDRPMALRSFSTDRYQFAQRRPAQPPEDPQKHTRAPRKLVTGVALTAQKCRLILTTPEGPVLSYPCRVIDVANGGYCISLLGAERLPADYGTGMMAVLEQSDKSLTPVELRWLAAEKIGLKRLPKAFGI